MISVRAHFFGLMVRCHGILRVCVERGGTTGVSDEEEMDAGKPTLSGPGCTSCGANRNNSGRVPEVVECGRGKEREYVQHRLTARYLRTERERRKSEEADRNTNA